MTAMLVWIGRFLLVVGVVGLVAGLANIVAPGLVFPSRQTCITDYDLLMCYIYPWEGAPWLGLVGGAALVVAGAVLWRQSALIDRSADDTR